MKFDRQTNFFGGQINLDFLRFSKKNIDGPPFSSPVILSLEN